MEKPAQPDLEREKFDWEVESQRADLALRERELSWKIQEARRSRWTSPLFLAVVAAVVGLFGNAMVAIIQGANSVHLKESETTENLRLEKEKLTSNLILEAIKTGNTQTAATNLLFLAQLGLIKEDAGKLSKFLDNPAHIPVLPSNNAASSTRYLVQLSNDCNVGVKAVIGYMTDYHVWRFDGWLPLAPRTTSSVTIFTNYGIIAVYAQTADGTKKWAGDTNEEVLLKFGEELLPFRLLAIVQQPNPLADNVTAAGAILYGHTFACQ